MKQIQIGRSQLKGSEIILGCMRLNQKSEKEAQELVEKAYELGINFFDHADIYGGGVCETLFGKVLKNTTIPREDIMIQSKCGIRKGFFDFSKEHVLKSVDESLDRLGVEYLDVLLLHRPDALMEPEEVAEAFVQLKKQGKVRHFGVSNQNPMQIRLLSEYTQERLLVNQLQFGLMHTPMLDAGFNVNLHFPQAYDRDGGIIEYCRLKDITIQAWSPFQYGFFEGVFLDHPEFKALNEVLEQIAQEKNTNKMAIATAWILRHPAHMQVVVGTTDKKRLEAIAQASEIVLSREAWYRLYRAAGNKLP